MVCVKTMRDMTAKLQDEYRKQFNAFESQTKMMYEKKFGQKLRN